MADPASKKDFQEVISNLKTFQDEAAEKRRKEDQIKYNEDQKRLMEIGKELKEANATDTLKLEAEKNKITQERSIEKLKQESGKRAVEIQKSGMELQKKAIEATGGVASDNKEYREEERRIKLTELAERKRNATSPAAKKEIAKEERELLGSYFERFLGKDSRLASGLTSIGEGLKAKVKGGLEGIFAAIKAGAFALFLLGLQKFLRSDLFKELKDKVIPALATGMTNMVESFKKLNEAIRAIPDTIDEILAGFYDEDGNFQFVAGIKNAMKILSETFEGTGTALATIGGLTLFAFRKQIIARAKGIGVRLLSMSGLTSAFGNNLDTVNSDMKKRNKASKGKRGIFGLGLRGIGSRFGRLFLRIGALGALIGGASLLMSGELKLGEKVGGVFDKVKTGFNSLFSVVGDFAKSIGRVATAAASATADAITSALKSVAKIGAKKPPKPVKVTRAMMDAIAGRGEFKPKIKPSAIGSPKVQTTVDDFRPKYRVPPSMDSGFKKGTDAAAAVRPITRVAQRLATLDTVIPKVPMMDLKSSKIKPTTFVDNAPVGKGGKAADIISQQKLITKVSAELSETALKTSLARKGVGVLLKAAPAIGIAAGVYLTASRALSGDLKGATAEFGGIFLPSLAGLPVDLGLAARDVYKDQFDIFPEDEPDKALRYERMKQITAYIKSNMPKKASIKPTATSESVFGPRALVPVGQYSSARTGGQRGSIMAGDETSALDQMARTMFLSQTINAPSQKQVFKIDKTIVGDAYADKIANR